MKLKELINLYGIPLTCKLGDNKVEIYQYNSLNGMCVANYYTSDNLFGYYKTYHEDTDGFTVLNSGDINSEYTKFLVDNLKLEIDGRDIRLKLGSQIISEVRI